jgi:uncharacterized protein (DUF2062 family)
LVPAEGFIESLTNLSLIFSDILLPCWVGSFITALPVAALGYWLSYQAVIAYRLRLRERRQLRLHDWKWASETGWVRIVKSKAK